MGLLKLRKFEVEEDEAGAILEFASWNSQGLLRFNEVEDELLLPILLAFATGL